MKKRVLSLLLVLMLVVSLVPTMALAEDDIVAYEVTGGNIYFNKSTGEITGCDLGVTEANIPSEIDGVKVTSIGDWVFFYSSTLTSVTIPDGVTSIDGTAFAYCPSLLSINVADANRAYSSADGVLFNKDKTELILYPTGKTDASYTIPDSVMSIGKMVFSGCTNLESIEVEEGNTAYTSVDGVLFNKEKTDLIRYPARKTDTSYIIPNSVTSISDAAFRGCESLTNVIIPNSVTSIGEQAFYQCTGIINIDIPNSITRINDSTFWGCTGLKSVTIPDSVTSIGMSAFSGCTSLTDITIPDGVTEIDAGTFCQCESLINVTIPNGVTTIGTAAFMTCTILYQP